MCSTCIYSEFSKQIDTSGISLTSHSGRFIEIDNENL